MIKGCRIFDGELAVSTGPGPMEIGVGEALPGTFPQHFFQSPPKRLLTSVLSKKKSADSHLR